MRDSNIWKIESLFFNMLRNIFSHWPVRLAMNIRGVNWILRPPLSSLCKKTRPSCVYIAVILTHVTDVNCLLGSAGVRDSRFGFFFFLPQKRRTKHIFIRIEFYYKSCTALVQGFCGPPSIMSQRHCPTFYAYFCPQKYCEIPGQGFTVLATTSNHPDTDDAIQ